MKKKGLIISTIVMVVVLIASLTTATYAWFSTSATTKVDTINVTIAAASDIDIGVTGSASYGATSSSNYKFENTTFAKTGNTYTVSGGTQGLGSSLKLGDFNLGTAVATTTEANIAQADLKDASVGAAFDPTKTIFAANVSGNPGDTNVGTPDMATAKIAVANTDYINLVLGARPNKDNVAGIVCKITVTSTNAADTLMMDAALRLLIRTGAAGVNQKEIDVFGGEYGSGESLVKMGRDTTKATVEDYSQAGVSYHYDTESGNASATIYFLVAGSSDASAAALDKATIQPLQIYGYIYGPDSDCVTAATGCSCTIDMEFIAVNAKNTAPAVEGENPSPAGVLYGVTYLNFGA